MAQTRRQAASRAPDLIIAGFLKEVRIPAPQNATRPPIPPKREDSIMVEAETKARPISHRLAAATKLFNTIHLPLRLYAPPAINQECVELFSLLERCAFAAITGESIMDFMLVSKPSVYAAQYLLDEVFKAAVRMALIDEEMEVLAHASGMALYLFHYDGRESEESIAETRLRIFEFVRAVWG
ncbi:hypothetical protein CC86DRAFT_409871 [Ophiobolus disseminans]|uniref:Uncharacterized protein n=1 Tax=Ophiobolus disseminans TaxID=1469910 RepID=A0A6A6ZS43_9PLEO|nr:hypothetical protein CC86DRAFT_409871 [Ophiobolus disseminans]